MWGQSLGKMYRHRRFCDRALSGERIRYLLPLAFFFPIPYSLFPIPCSLFIETKTAVVFPVQFLLAALQSVAVNSSPSGRHRCAH